MDWRSGHDVEVEDTSRQWRYIDDTSRTVLRGGGRYMLKGKDNLVVVEGEREF